MLEIVSTLLAVQYRNILIYMFSSHFHGLTSGIPKNVHIKLTVKPKFLLDVIEW